MKKSNHLIEDTIDSVLKDCSGWTVFLVSVSGGADSMAMFTALCKLFPKERLFCVHIDHGLRAEESKGDSEFVRKFCEKYGVNCKIKSIPPGKVESFARCKGTGIEAAARYFRRRALLRIADELESQGKNTLILTAHTKDDALELSLMRLLRGAGQAGLAKMPVKKGRFVRPILSISRKEVISYLKEKNVSWREDSTNTNEKFLRNKIRHTLIPFLDNAFPVWEKGILNMSETQELVADFIDKEAQRRVIWEKYKKTLLTDSGSFFSQSQIVREEALFQGIALLCCRRKNNTQNIRRSVIRQFCSGSLKTVDLGQVRLSFLDGKISISLKQKELFERGFSRLICR